MPTLDQEVARSFRTAQLQRRRWARLRQSFDADDIRFDQMDQTITACQAASEIEYRQSARRLFDVLDLMT